MKHALLVGINTYVGSPLQGCVNDVTLMAQYLQSKQYDSIVTCTNEQATTSSIRHHLHELVSKCVEGDSLFFHYSGHGSQIPCRNGSESDGMTEIICPVDINFHAGTFVTDDELHSIFCSIPSGVHLEVVLDCCHSGTALRDINFDYVSRFLPPPLDYKGYDAPATRELVITNFANANNTILWAACRSNETAADARIGSTFNGAFTFSLLRSLEHAKTRKELESSITEMMSSRGWPQHAQLECSSDKIECAFLD